MNIPTVVLIRNPEETVASYLVFQGSTNADMYLRTYSRFYKQATPLLDKAIVSDFATTTGDFNKVIQAVNSRYGTNYQIVENLGQRQDEIFEQLRGVNERFLGGQERRTLYPDGTRESYKQNVRRFVTQSRFLAEASGIYERIIKHSV